MAEYINLLASGIADVKHFVAFDKVVHERFANYPLDRLLVYLIDTVDESALPFLAEQFDVLGYKGMRLAKTVEEKREIIKKAIEVKRHAGTTWAVREALRSIGYPDAIITENAGTNPDYGWAQFRINIDVGEKPISADNIAELVEMINIYKRYSSHLLDISYTIVIDDSLVATDSSFEDRATNDIDEMILGGDFKHDGQYTRNGDKNYSSDTDVLEIQIINV